jgi:DNA-binding winged helix-turn-helix (wHTH) protein
MEQQPFYINNHFFTDPAANIIREIKGTREIHLEPRLMRLLCLLSNNEGKVISREFLINEIWNDYGGADEGLTQAIFFLRKVIGDRNKEIIETVPKKGYILHATISKDIDGKTIEIEKKTGRYHKFWLAAAITGILFFCFFYFKKAFFTPGIRPSESGITATTNDSSTDSLNIMDTDVRFPDINKGDAENYLNTISTTDSNGVKYRLTLIRDRRPKFYVNGKIYSDDIPEKYAVLIDELSKELWERQAKVETSSK